MGWEEAQTLVARATLNIMETYQGETGARRLRTQGYPPEMVEAMNGAGPRTVKCRAGMWLTGTHIGALYRFANGISLFDEAEARRHGREPMGGGARGEVPRRDVAARHAHRCPLPFRQRHLAFRRSRSQAPRP